MLLATDCPISKKSFCYLKEFIGKTLSHFLFTACLLTFLQSARAQFTEAIFYDTVSKISADGLITGVNNTGDYFYLTGGSFSAKQSIPSLTKMDTAGKVIWTAIDPVLTGLLGKKPDINSSIGSTSHFLKDGNFIFTVSQNNQLWCLSDSSGSIVWKISIPGDLVLKVLNYSATELVLLIGPYGLQYLVINKQTGIITYSHRLLSANIYAYDAEMLVDNGQNILVSWGDTCYKYNDKELTQLAWKSALPYYSNKSVERIMQDSSTYVLSGLNNVRVIDSATGNLIWYDFIQVGNVPLVQSGASCNPKKLIIKDSLIYITWVSPYVGGLDFRMSFTLTCINKYNGSLRYNVAYDFEGVPPDSSLPHTHEELDWPADFCMDPAGNIYMTGSYDNSMGPETPGNWGIMKLDGRTGAKIFESTITRDSLHRDYFSKGVFIGYKYGKLYAAGNLIKRYGTDTTQPVMISFDEADVYRERLRISPTYTIRYPSALTGMDSVGNSKMVLLKMIGRSSVLELRNVYNQPIWSRTFNRPGKFMVPQMVRNLRDTAIAASFFLYKEEPVNKIMIGSPDAIVFVRIDTLGQIKYTKEIAHITTDSIAPEPVQIYTDEFNRTNFIYRRKVYDEIFDGWNSIYYSFMMDGPPNGWSALTGDRLPEEERSLDLRKNVASNIADTMVIFRTTPGILSNAHFCSDIQTASNGYTGFYLKKISQFQMIYSSVICESTGQIVFGRDSSGRMLTARYNFHLPQPLVWSSVQSSGTYYTGAVSDSGLYAIGKLQTGDLVVSKIDKSDGLLRWNFTRPPQSQKSWIPLDYRYDKINGQFTLGGALLDSSSGALKRSYFYITLDSNGTAIRDVERLGDLFDGTQINIISTLQNGSHFYGGRLSNAAFAVVGFYNAECFGNNIVPTVNITTKDSLVCPGTNIVFNANAGAGGLHPQFQWQINGINTGSGSDTLIAGSLNNDDQLVVTMISSADCLKTNTTISSPFHILLADTLKPAILISAETNVHADSSSLISSLVMNLSENGIYQWQDSTHMHTWLNISNAPGSTLLYSPGESGDKLRCILNFSKPCNPNSRTISNELSFVIEKENGANSSSGENHGIRYYPNPVASVLNIDSIHSEDMWQSVQIMSMIGAVIQTSLITSNQSRLTLDLKSLETGVYLAVLRGTKYKPVYLKFIKR